MIMIMGQHFWHYYASPRPAFRTALWNYHCCHHCLSDEEEEAPALQVIPWRSYNQKAVELNLSARGLAVRLGVQPWDTSLLSSGFEAGMDMGGDVERSKDLPPPEFWSPLLLTTRTECSHSHRYSAYWVAKSSEKFLWSKLLSEDGSSEQVYQRRSTVAAGRVNVRQVTFIINTPNTRQCGGISHSDAVQGVTLQEVSWTQLTGAPPVSQSCYMPSWHRAPPFWCQNLNSSLCSCEASRCPHLSPTSSPDPL